MGVYLLGVIGIVSITGFFVNNLATFDNSSTSNSASAHTKSKQSGQKAQGFGQRVPTYATIILLTPQHQAVTGTHRKVNRE